LEEPEPEPEPSWDRYGEAWDDWDDESADLPPRQSRSGRRPVHEEDDPWV